ncbi:palmitoyltransferase for Vac8p [Kickxella alabastrina]|uniref:Palmitoyltransferase for Vac8p n=1 Tax=Kickxella alabastrina TaxID=61397 RepID=A0ACC1IN28_9FUNG|nr:palmitoyltransferase for Vac8p [Kickxella alabastrina]
MVSNIKLNCQPSSWNRHKVYKTLGFFPVLFTLGLLGWSLLGNYRSVLPQIHDDSRAAGIIYGTVLTVIWTLSLWSYFICVFKNPGNPRAMGAVGAHGGSATNGPYVRVPGIVDTTHLSVEAHREAQRARLAPASRQRHADDDESTYDSQSDESDDGSDSCSEAGRAPLTDDQMRQSELIYAITVRDNGQPRYCLKCNVPKPDRSHHCSICGVCVLKMDHHCPWLNNCVGFHTQKAFMLFLLYTMLYCLATFISTLVYFLRLFSGPLGTDVALEVVIMCILSGPFTLCLMGFGGYHIYLMLVNLTTIESYERNTFRLANDQNSTGMSKKVNLFDVGMKKNFVQLFGTHWTQWLVPTASTMGDGVRFPISFEAYNELCQS